MTKANPTLSKSEKVHGVLAYIGFFCIVPLVLKKDSQFAQFHGKQGLVLTAIAWSLMALLVIIPTLRGMVGFLYFCASVFGIVMAVQGKMTKIPGIGDMAEKLEL